MKSKQNQNEIKTTTHQDVDVDVNVYVNNKDKIISFIESNFNRTISSYEYETLMNLKEKYGEDLVLCALKKSLEAGKTSMNYYKGILKNWKDDGIDTVEKAMSESKKDSKILKTSWYGKEIESKPEDEETKTMGEDFKEFLKNYDK